MKDRNALIKKMDTRLASIDAEIEKIDRYYEDEDVPKPVRKKIQQLVDARKDIADLVQQLKWVAENSWDELEVGVNRKFDELTQSIESLSKQLSR